MHQSYCLILLLVVLTILICPFYFQLNKSVSNIEINPQGKSFIIEPLMDNFTCCLLDMSEALGNLSISWFLNYGTALMYWRSKNFISNDMDIGVFYEDLQARNFNETIFLLFMKNKFTFYLDHSYGEINHGREWTFICPQSQIYIDIFVFYPYYETTYNFAYWTASHNGLCNEMIYKKCRWGFPKFNLTRFKMYGKEFRVVSLEFIIERYGKDYMIPKNYDYFQSLNILPNLISEYRNQMKNSSVKLKTNISSN